MQIFIYSMKRIAILLFLLILLVGSSQLFLRPVFAQYCFPVGPFCNALGQSCSGDTCSGTSCVPCAAGCNAGTGLCNPTYSISGNVFVDTNGNTVKDVGESGYNGANVNVGGVNRTTDVSGNYSRANMGAGTYAVTLTVPVGYQATTPNPVSKTLPPNAPNVNFGIQLVPPPACTGGLSALPNNVNPGGTSTLSVTSCTDINPPPPGPVWNPDTGGNNPPPSVGGQTDTPTSSTVTWTAPACPPVTTIYTPQVTVTGAGGSTSYSTSITVPGTFTVTTNVRSVTDTSSCTSSSGTAYNNGAGSGANVNITNGTTVNQNTTTDSTTGQGTFTCLPSGSYQETLQVPAGYTVTGRTVSPGPSSNIGSNGVSFSTGPSQTTTFCIAPIVPWFQTDKGDVRFLNLSNPVPSGRYGSTDVTYPGIYYSSNSNANLGSGTASVKNWVINNEYSYNSDTENRNGGMSYDFYKSKARQDGITITPLAVGTFDQAPITGSGIYEAPGDLTINLYTHVNGRRVVILVNGNVTINAPISISQNQGVLIIAAKGNITVSKTVGVAYNTDYVLGTSATHSLDGYYSAQGSIILDGDTCPDGSTVDLRLNIGGALIANSLKPFSTTGTGTIQNKRSVCANSTIYPSLFVASRPDFITQLTDFYKTSYTKWQEVNP